MLSSCLSRQVHRGRLMVHVCHAVARSAVTGVYDLRVSFTAPDARRPGADRMSFWSWTWQGGRDAELMVSCLVPRYQPGAG